MKRVNLVPDGCVAFDFDPKVTGHNVSHGRYGVLTTDGLVRISWNKTSKGKNKWDSNDGTTEFRTSEKAGWRSYDRYGLDSSFYFVDATDLAKQIPKQIARARAGIAVALEPHFYVPDMPYSMRAERRDALRVQLKKQGIIDLHPSGMGTAHHITTRPRGNFSTAGSNELCEFFGVQQCWVSTYDYD
jgi:hypothetical protein